MEMCLATARAKRSCAERGYLSDPYASQFVSSSGHHSDPSINRGYYARIRAIDMIVDEFVKYCGEEDGVVQIVVLGAGFDTSFWRRNIGVKYYEIDSLPVASAKAEAIEKSESLSKKLGVVERIDKEEGVIESSRYHLAACDLRDVAKVAETLDGGLDASAPTVFVAECVLAYLDPEASTAVLKWTATFPRALVVDYDMMAPDDAFGKIMAANFERKGWPIVGATTFKSLQDHRRRVTENVKFEKVHAANMDTVCSRFVLADQEERRRVSRLEIFDDPDEFKLMMEHYCLVLAANGTEACALLHSFQTALDTEPSLQIPTSSLPSPQ